MLLGIILAVAVLVIVAMTWQKVVTLVEAELKVRAIRREGVREILRTRQQENVYILSREMQALVTRTYNSQSPVLRHVRRQVNELDMYLASAHRSGLISFEEAMGYIEKAHSLLDDLQDYEGELMADVIDESYK
jgi:hypothetical protein